MHASIRKSVYQLSLAQALMMSVNTLLLTSSAIIGLQFASDKSLATLPLAIQFLAGMLTTIPASLLMKKWGRKHGFYLSSMIGLTGSVIAIYSIINQSFIMFCLSTLFFGIYTGFGNYFRFVAAEISHEEDKNVAISYVLVGGIAAAIIGPNLAIYSKDIFDIAYIGSFVAVFILYLLNWLNFKLIKIVPIEHKDTINDPIRPLIQIIKQPVFIVALSTAMFGYALMALLMTATPLAMKAHEYHFSDIAFIIQWHVLGMFVPSFFTGHLINRFGFTMIASTGALLYLLSATINLIGTEINHYWISLVSLGVGWNFLFISGTSKLTEAYNDAEKAKTQAINDFFIFSSVTAASLGSGMLQFHFGWQAVNVFLIPFIIITFSLIIWLAWFEKAKKN